MSVKEVTYDMLFATKKERAAFCENVARVFAFVKACTESGTYPLVEFTHPELCATLEMAQQANKTVFALTPTAVYLLHLAYPANGSLLVEVEESDVQRSSESALVKEGRSNG